MGLNTAEALTPTTLMFTLVVLGLLPFFLTLVTSYIKIIVVSLLIRNALGIQQIPPTMVLTSLAIILSVFVMTPVGVETYNLLQNTNLKQDVELLSLVDVISNVSEPLRSFLKANTDDSILTAFMNTAKQIWPKDIHYLISKDSFIFIVPSFVISELTKAFQIGFLLYLPFIAIDLIISNILLAMGMMMVSPMTISLPFKLMLFVTLNGWFKLSQGLLYSYSYGT